METILVLLVPSKGNLILCLSIAMAERTYLLPAFKEEQKEQYIPGVPLMNLQGSGYCATLLIAA